MAQTSAPAALSVAMCGTGEYTTGFTPQGHHWSLVNSLRSYADFLRRSHAGQSKSDKKVGVVGLVMFDLRRRGKVVLCLSRRSH
jgi:D-galacturonate reductase